MNSDFEGRGKLHRAEGAREVSERQLLHRQTWSWGGP